MKKTFQIMLMSLVVLSFFTSCTQSNDTGKGIDSKNRTITSTGRNAEVTDDTVYYSITFDKNGAEVSGTMDAQFIAGGTTANLTANAFTKTDYTFTGWVLSRDGEVSSSDQASFTMGSLDVTLYAKWEHNSIVSLSKRDMVYIDGGTFNQNYGVLNFDHSVSNYKMAKFETTYQLWHAVYQWAILNGYIFAYKGREGNDGGTGVTPTTGNFEPVTTINWRDAVIWCNAYSEMAGLNPVYTFNGSVIKDSRTANAAACDQAVCDWSKNGYRLPSEGEWQYAASNKGATPYNYASGATADYTNAAETRKVAWYSVNSGGSTRDVGTTVNSSALTLCDMSGNVMEWCWDWFAEYPTTAQVDYRGISTGTSRIVRGGCFRYPAAAAMLGFRLEIGPASAVFLAGFRVARTY
jgi:uncharacterized repeat protein (TIGR02543 family)